MQIAICIALGIVGILIGGMYGGFPLKTTEMTRKQESYGSTLGVIALGITVLLILLGMNLESYIFIAAVIIGFVITKIPPIHLWLISKFKIFTPKKSKKTRK
ncbi:hypothetical protein ACFQY8_02110 [Alloscardovia venturai]|uniref:Uncharacterized protein n=1 Tax=Alloscardovia venturai TaxID=1769421 RepID=A0ABW2Y5C3_9BIFI